MEYQGRQPERDHKSGRVGEYLYLSVPEFALQLIAMANAKTTTVRFEGKRTHDHKLKNWERQSLQDVLTLTKSKPNRLDAAKQVLKDRRGKAANP